MRKRVALGIAIVAVVVGGLGAVPRVTVTDAANAIPFVPPPPSGFFLFPRYGPPATVVTLAGRCAPPPAGDQLDLYWDTTLGPFSNGGGYLETITSPNGTFRYQTALPGPISSIDPQFNGLPQPGNYRVHLYCTLRGARPAAVSTDLGSEDFQVTGCGTLGAIRPAPWFPDVHEGAGVGATIPVTNFFGDAHSDIGSYSAKIDWGDGFSSLGKITQLFVGVNFVGCEVSARHTYSIPGHYATSVSIASRSSRRSGPGIVVGNEPAPAAAAGSAVGVLTGPPDTPQCTGTVINLSRSWSPDGTASADLARDTNSAYFKQYPRSGIVLTAAHCVAGVAGNSGADIRFAPGFTGIAPRYSGDFDTGRVSQAGSTFGSPYAGSQIGSAPLGVWRANGADVILNPQFSAAGGDAAYDWAFVAFGDQQQNGKNLQDAVGGGMAIEFNPILGIGARLHHVGYDINWSDAPPPGYSSGATPYPGETDCRDLARRAFGLSDAYTCTSLYRDNTAGPHACHPQVVGLFKEGPPATGPSVGAAPCNLGDFSSGAPFFYAGSLVGITRGTANIFGYGSCCVTTFTQLTGSAVGDAICGAELLLPAGCDPRR